MAKKYRRAPLPTKAEREAREAAREAERERVRAAPSRRLGMLKPRPVAAEPGETPDRSVPPTERRFRVCGNRKVAGKGKGEIVILVITDDVERSLCEAGHIEPCPETEERPVQADEVKEPENG